MSAENQAEKDQTFRIRWTTTVDVVVEVTVRADELDPDDGIDAEEYAYDQAVEFAKERLDQVAVPMGHVAIHGDIDGMEADVQGVFDA